VVVVGSGGLGTLLGPEGTGFLVWSLVDGAGLRHTGCHLIPGLPLCGFEGMGGGVWWRVGLVAVCCL